MSELPDNWTHVRGSFYIVRTQAGLRQALRHFGRMNDEEVRGYPRSYPALISISYGYTGSTFYRVDAVHLSQLQDKLAHQGHPIVPPPAPHVVVVWPPKMTITRVLNDVVQAQEGPPPEIEPTRSALYYFFKDHDLWGLISPAQLTVTRLTSAGWGALYMFGIYMDTILVGYTNRPLEE